MLFLLSSVLSHSCVPVFLAALGHRRLQLMLTQNGIGNGCLTDFAPLQPPGPCRASPSIPITSCRGVQGAFILVGNNDAGYPLLLVMAMTVYMYAVWRFWEGITGQGSDDAFGPFKNFFKYRLSPLVSVSTLMLCLAAQIRKWRHVANKHKEYSMFLKKQKIH